jgi:ATP-dependent protease Clp ATPase subunit
MSLRHCSFCGLSEDEVNFLVASRPSYICDACVEQCVKVLAKAQRQARQFEAASKQAPS